MERISIFRILLILCLVSVSMLVVTPTYADTHFQFVIPIDDTAPWILSCDGEQLVSHAWGNIRVNAWLDENGDITTEAAIFGNLKETVSANGKTINIQLQGPIRVYYTDNGNKVITTGTNGLITIPGYGLVSGWAGLMIDIYYIDPITGEEVWTNVKAVGNFNNDDTEAICTYLGY